MEQSHNDDKNNVDDGLRDNSNGDNGIVRSRNNDVDDDGTTDDDDDDIELTAFRTREDDDDDDEEEKEIFRDELVPHHPNHPANVETDGVPRLRRQRRRRRSPKKHRCCHLSIATVAVVAAIMIMMLLLSNRNIHDDDNSELLSTVQNHTATATIPSKTTTPATMTSTENNQTAPAAARTPAPTFGETTHTDPDEDAGETTTNEDDRDVKVVAVDIIVIGAGMAGIMTTQQLQERAPHLKVILLEASDRIGGRVWSFNTSEETSRTNTTTNTATNSTNSCLLQYGANWLYYHPPLSQEEQNPDTLIYEQFVGKNQTALDDYLNITAYELWNEEGTTNDRTDSKTTTTTTKPWEAVHQIPKSVLNQYRTQWKEQIIPCMYNITHTYWEDDDDDYRRRTAAKYNDDDEYDLEDDLQAFEYCGWNSTDAIDYMYKTIFFDYDYATQDGSIYDWGDPTNSPKLQMYFVTGDWNSALMTFAAQHNIRPIYNTRVTKINYDYNVDQDNTVKAQVEAINEVTGEMANYNAQRVISTVSVGIYDHELIEFEPPLKYPAQQYNPMKLKNYVKIWYQFSTKFWQTEEDAVGGNGDGDESQYIVIVNTTTTSTSSAAAATHFAEMIPNVTFWKDLDRPNIFPGSHMLLLALFDEDFTNIVGADKVRQYDIDEQVLYNLLEPLRTAYQESYVEPIAIYQNHFHALREFGYGAYSSFEYGYSPYDYFHFWGPYDHRDYICNSRGHHSQQRFCCDYNGCNSHEEWILHFGGADSCLEYPATVHGAAYSGIQSAMYVLQSLGIPVDKNWDNQCYTDE